MAKSDILQLQFLIFDGFPMACLTSVIEPLRAANEILGQRMFSWALVSETQGPVRSSADISFEPEAVLADLDRVEMMILLSAPTASFAQPGSAAKLRNLSRHGAMMGAISGGVFPLVRSGLCAGHAISVHWCYRAAFEQDFPSHAASDKVIEQGARLVTASGAAAAFDLALQLIKARAGDAVATEVACWFQHPMMRGAGVDQAVPVHHRPSTEEHLPDLVQRATVLMADRLNDPVSVAELALSLQVTPRHLERVFKRATGKSPSQYYRTMRMKAARQILLYSNTQLAELARTMGYPSIRALQRQYEAEFGISPQEDRKQINLYRAADNLPVPSY